MERILVLTGPGSVIELRRQDALKEETLVEAITDIEVAGN